MRRVFSVALFLVVSSVVTTADGDDVDFTRDIRPILSEYCFQCHGPDEVHRKADLRLDTREDALNVIEVHQPDESELIRRIESDDPDEVMPPPSIKRELSKAQIAMLRKWVESGANWADHWSYTPIAKPDVPEVDQQPDFPVRNTIDQFVQYELRERGLSPSAEASRAILIRRLTMDLTGLPPTTQEVKAFVDDDSADAYERLVDRLLASPAYGERMAWDWLDAARYSDSNGYQGDRERTMWPWRDWVVQAFNENLPYDQFTVWQLAGDLMPDATHQQKLATGFCRNHMINGEGGRIAEENRVDYVMDMTETMGTVWLGLTLNCCRCHDHKFDTIKNSEYYQFFAFFNQTPVSGGGGNPQTPPILGSPSAEQRQREAVLLAETKTLQETRARRRRELLDGLSQWEKSQGVEQKSGPWNVLKPTQVKADSQQLSVMQDQSILAAGPNPANDNYTILTPVDAGSLTAIRLEALRHPSMTQGGIARSDSGNFVLTSFSAELLVENQEPRRLDLVAGPVTYEQSIYKVAETLNDQSKIGWAVYQGKPIDRDHTAILRLREPVEIPEGGQLRFTLKHQSRHAQHNLGRFRLSATDTADPKLGAGNATLQAALATPLDQRTDEQRKLIETEYFKQTPEYQELEKRLATLQKDLGNLRNGFPKVMVMGDMPNRRKTFILEKGLYSKPKDEVDANVPEMLPSIAAQGPLNRLHLAQWLIDAKNPLTARVTVNRFWQQVFGIGLVKTVEDFGVQGEVPVHRDLLDWLSADFRDHGWDVKRLMKQMVMSHTYRQSSMYRKELATADPENRLHGRSMRQRWPSWMLRDQALRASGLLVDRRGGPPVKGYQPPGIWEEATFVRKGTCRTTEMRFTAAACTSSGVASWGRPSSSITRPARPAPSSGFKPTRHCTRC